MEHRQPGTNLCRLSLQLQQGASGLRYRQKERKQQQQQATHSLAVRWDSSGELSSVLSSCCTWNSLQNLPVQQASVVRPFKARGSQHWVPCGGHPGENVSLRLLPRFNFWHPCCCAPLLLRAGRDAYLVRGGESPHPFPLPPNYHHHHHHLFFYWREGALLWLNYKTRSFQEHSLAVRFIFTFCLSKFIAALVLMVLYVIIIRQPLVKEYETMFLRTCVE